MRFNRFAGTAIVPTLSRIVLVLVFFTAGWNKVFTVSSFDGPAAARLEALGVHMSRSAASLVPQIRLAGYQAEDAAPADSPTVEPQPDEPAPAPGSSPPPTPSLAPTDGTPGKARTLHRITLLCDGAGLPRPRLLAWTAALTELVGGALLAVGLLSRIWGLGLAIAMGVAIHLTTWGPYWETGPLAVAAGADGMALFNRVSAQLALLVLGLGVALVGPGPLSLDHLIVRRQPKPTDALGYDLESREVVEKAGPRSVRPGDDDKPERIQSHERPI